ncbi:MAG: rod-binding protein [Bacteriovoracaceae bacterium]|nr:rod-binding protein [Bacteriovoracaceae bacterium]
MSLTVNARKPMTIEQARKPYEQVAEAMDTQFSEHLIQEMRKSVQQETPDSTALNYYNSVMDHERAKLMAKDPNGGLGIKKLILEQILPQNLKPKAVSGNMPKMKPSTDKEISHE